MRRYHETFSHNVLPFGEPKRKMGVSLGGGSSSSSGGGSQYKPKHLQETDQPLYDQMMAELAKTNPYEDPNNQYTTLANSLMTNAQSQQNGAYSDYLNQYLNGAFDTNADPTYQYYLDKTLQGTRSGLTARGLNTSPYGAGIEGQAVTDYAMQAETKKKAEQQAALSAYLSGQQGIQGLGQNALSTATSLESLKKGWNQQDITNMLNYLQLGTQGRNNSSSESTNFNLGLGTS